MRNRSGTTTAYSYDNLDRESQVVETKGTFAVTLLTGYDAAGNVSTTTNGRGFTTTFSYDGDNRLAQEVGPLLHTMTYSRDAAGEPTAVTDALGKTTSYAYDGLGRVTLTKDPDNRWTYAFYDADGN